MPFLDPDPISRDLLAFATITVSILAMAMLAEYMGVLS